MINGDARPLLTFLRFPFSVPLSSSTETFPNGVRSQTMLWFSFPQFVGDQTILWVLFTQSVIIQSILWISLLQYVDIKTIL
jgi:hypothetical protein